MRARSLISALKRIAGRTHVVVVIALVATVAVAIPVIAAVSTALNGNGNTGLTTLVVTKPAGLQAGEVMIANIVVRGPATTGVTAPAGWQLITKRTNADNGTVASRITQATYYKAATATDVGVANYTWTFSVDEPAAGGIESYSGMRLSNLATTDPGYQAGSKTATVDQTASTPLNDTVGVAATTSAIAPTVTTTANDETVVGLFANDDEVTYSEPAAQDYAIAYQNARAGNQHAAVAVAGVDADKATAGPTGAKTITASISSRWVAQTITLRKKIAQTISFTQPTPKTFGTTFNVNPTSDSGLAVSVGASGGCTIAAGAGGSYDVTMTSGTTNCVLTASQAGDGTYTAATNVVRTVTAQKASQTINFTAPASPRTYGETFNVNPTSSSGLPVTVTKTGGCNVVAATGPGFDVTMTSGTTACELTAQRAGNNDYAAATDVARTVNASKKQLDVDAQPKSKTYGDADPIFTWSYDGFVLGDNATSANITGAANCTRAAGEGVGTHAITCAPGTLSAANYSFAAGDSANLTINQRPITGDFTAANKVYDGGTAAVVTGRSVAGKVGAEDVNLSGGTATFASKTVANNKTVTLAGATLAGADAGNYTLSSVDTALADITPLAITGDFTAGNKVYDGNTSATVLTRTLAGVVSGDTVSLSGGTATFGSKDVASNKTVTLAGATLAAADAGNYTLSSVDTALADVTPKAITGDFTAGNKVYDGNTSATVLTRTLAGDLPADDVDLDGGTATFGTKAVANNKTVTLTGASLIGADAGNYSLSSVDTALANITPLAITGDFTAGNKVYDGNTSATVLTRTLAGDVSGDTVSLSGGTATFGSKDVGNNKTVTLTGASLAGPDAGNYTLSSVDTALADVTAKAITGDFTAANKAYDGNTSATVLTRTLVGDVPADDVDLDGGTATFGSKDVANGKTVTLAGASLIGADAGNYTLSSVDTALADINQRPITGDFTAANKVYDGGTAAVVTGRSVAGKVGTEDVQLDGGTATFGSKHVGNNKTVTLAGATLAGADAGNYTLSSVDTALADITPLAITGDFTAGNKVYDGNTSATVLTRTLAGVVSGDTVSLSGGTATFGSKDVASNKTVTLAGASLAGADAGNYTLSSVDTALADITAKAITGDFTAANKVYDGGTAAVVTGRSVIGKVGTEDVQLDGGTAAFGTKDVANNKTVTLTGATLAGADAGNYTLASVDTALADVTPLAITGDFTAANKVYDGNTSATVTGRTLAGEVSGDTVSLSGGTATFGTKDVGNNKTVTLAGASLAGADAGNYTLSSVDTALADVTPLAITGDFTAGNKVYDGNTSATVLTRTLAGDVPADDVDLDGGTATFGSKDVANNKTVTLVGASLAGPDAGNYTLSSVDTALANITPKAITGDFTAGNKVYDGNTSATVLTRTLAGDVSGDTVSLSGGTATFGSKDAANNKTVTLVGATLAGADAGNYTLSSVDTALADVTAKAITGDFTAGNKVYDGNTSATVLTRTLAGDVSGDTVSLSGGTATFGSKDVANGKTVTLVGASLAGADAGNYTLSSVDTALADITAKAITGDFTAGNKVYDGNTSATVLTRTLAGDVPADDVDLDGGTAAFGSKDVGSNKTVTLTGASLIGADAGNYTLASVDTALADITQKSVTGSFTAANKVYDGNTSANVTSRSVNGKVTGDDVDLVGTATFGTAAVGTGKTVTLGGTGLSGADAGNYNLTSVGTTTANITPKTLTGSFTAANKVYDGGTVAAITGSTLGAGAVGADDVTLDGGAASAAFANKNVGTGKTVSPAGFVLAGADAGNYSLSMSTTTADITAKSLTGQFTAANKVYDGNTDAVVTGRSVTGKVTGDAVDLSGGTATFGSKTVATGKTVTLAGAALSGADAGNYTLSSVDTTTADITAKALTGHFTADNKVYDATTAATVATRSLTGVVSGDTVTLTGGTATFGSKTAGSGKTVTLTGASISGADVGNYNLTGVDPATANITAKDVTGSFTAPNKVYDGTTASAVTTRSLSGVISGDTASLSGGTATFGSKTVGTGKTVTLSGASLAGADAGNYNLAGVDTTTANITAKSLAGQFTAQHKVYDGTAAATVATRTLTGVVSGDVVSLSGGTATFGSKTVGNGKTVTLSGASLAGADAGNYTLGSVATTTANITALTVTGHFTAQNKVYNGNTSATVNGTSVPGAVAGDDLALSSGTANFASKTVGNGKTVIATSGFALTGADAGNYLLTGVADTTADITAKALTGQFTAQNKVYDGNTSATVASRSLTGVVSGDTVSLTGGTATFGTKTVADGKTVTLSGASLSGSDAGNYALSGVDTATADITAKALTGHFTADNKVYDGNTSATVASRSVTGVVSGDTVSLSGGTATFGSKTVGNGKTVTLSGATLAGADAGNYNLAGVDTTTANITAKALTISGAAAQNKVYDRTTAATVGFGSATLNGVVGGDTVTIDSSGYSASFGSAGVGTGKPVTVTGVALGGADAGNYSVSQPSGLTANITAKSLVGNFTAQNKVYDGTTAATVASRSLVGVVSGDTVSLSGGTATFGSKDVGNAKTVTLSGATLSGADAGNYSLGSVNTATADITKKDVTGSFSAPNKVYDGNTSSAVSTRSLSGDVPADDVDLSGGTATFGSKTVGNAKTVTLTGAGLSGADAGNYNLTTVGTTTADITAKALTGQFTAANKVYDGNTSATVAGRSLTGAVAGDTVSLSGGTATFGTKTVAPGKTVTLSGASLSGADAGNYSLSSVDTATADITKKDVTGAFTAQNKVYDGNTSATVAGRSLTGAVSGDTVSLSGGTATFGSKTVGNGKTVTLSGATLAGADAGNYNLAGVDPTTADITAKALTISGAAAQNKVYDRTTAATVGFGSATLNGVVGGDTVTIDSSGYSASFGSAGVGTGKAVTVTGVALGGADAGNYSVSQPSGLTADITKKALTVSGASAQNKVYDGNTTATVGFGSATLNGVLGGDTVTIDSSGYSASFGSASVGTGKAVTVLGVALGGADAGNYSVSQPTGLTADITKKALTISGAAAQNKVYDRTTAATVGFGSATLNGVVGGDTVTIDSSGYSASFGSASAGTGKAVTVLGVALGGASAGNYSVSQPAGLTANITPKSLVGNFTAQNKVYDATTAATVASRSLVGVVSGDTVSLSGGTATFGSKDVGNTKTVTLSGATLSGADAGNYSLGSVNTATADITKKDVTGSFTAQNKVYDGNTSATVAGRSLTGAVAGDTVSLSGGTATFGSKTVGSGKTVTLSGAGLSGADAGNYNLTTVGTTTADITAKALTGQFTAQNKVYDGDTSATVAGRSLTGAVSGDTVSLSGGTATFGSKTVGNGKTVTLSGASLSGADAGNYSLSSVDPATANITAKSLVGNFTAQNKVYDATTAATVAGRSLVGVVSGDTVSLSGGTATFGSKDVGNTKTVTLSGATLSGADAGNYSLGSVNTTTADITKKDVTGSFSAPNKVYDGNTSSAVSTRSLSGDVPADDVDLAGGTATFGSKTVGSAKTVTLTGAGLSGADAGNYNLTTVGTTTADITAKALTGQFTAANKVYDGDASATALTRSVTGKVSGDDVDLSGGTASFGSAAAANGKTVTLSGASLSGADAGNYSLSSVDTTIANITPKSLVGSFTAANKPYDGNTSATVTGRSVAGKVGSDVVNHDGGTATFDNPSVGTGKTVTLAGAALTGADAGNYSLTSVDTTTADITKKTLTISGASAQNKVYDGNDGATVGFGSATLNGVEPGDTVTIESSGYSAAFNNGDAGTGKAVTVSGVTLSGANAGAYSLAQPSGLTADITPKAITGGFTAASKEYDASTDATVTGRSVAGEVAGDQVDLGGGTASFGSKAVGNGKTVTLTGGSLTGDDAGNYSLSGVDTATANITPKTLTGSFTAANKVYDTGTVATITGSSLGGGAVGSDEVGLSRDAATASFASADAGTGKTVTPSGFALTGADKDNYTLSMENATADITLRGVRGSFTAADRPFDGTTAATILTRTLAGVIPGDAVQLIGGTAAFADPNVGADKPVTGAGFVLAGADARNYRIALVVPTTADITQRAPAPSPDLDGAAEKLLGGDVTLLGGLKLGGLADAFGPAGQTSSVTYNGAQGLIAIGGCATACTIGATSVVELTGTSQASASATRRMKLRSQSLSLKAGQMGVLKLKLTRKQQARIRKAKRARLIMKITVRAGDRTASGTKTYRLKLKRR